MNRRQKIIVSITGIFIVLLALVGLTYGYFLTRIQGNTNTKSISVTTADLKIVYGDGSPNIEALKIVPGDTIGTKKFTVANEGNATVTDYKVYLENVQNSFEIKSDVEYTLTCKSYEKYGATGQAISGTCAGVEDATTFPSVMTVIATNTIAVGITHEYELTVTYENQPYDQSVDMNKTLKAKVNIYDGKTEFLSNKILDNIKSTETVNYNKTTLSTEMNKVAASGERIMSSTIDDYGTSYYYSGDVEDNYVTYSGMCWRIVRILGNGAIKLVLADENNTCENGYSTTNTTSAFITATNTSPEDFDGTVFPFQSSDKYTSNYKNSFAESLVYNWLNKESFSFTTGFSQDPNSGSFEKNIVKTQLISTKFCSDMSIKTLQGKGKDENWEYTETEDPSNIYWYVEEYYGHDGYSLKCNFTGLNDSQSEIINANIGLLTVDEVYFASQGGYLKTNSEDNYWTMTPYAKIVGSNWDYGLFDYNYIVNTSGNATTQFIDVGGNQISYRIRPVITISPTATILDGGVGTYSNPYVIESQEA